MKVQVAPSCQLLPAPGTAQRAVSRCLSRGRRAPGSLRWMLRPVVRWGMAGRGAGGEPGDSVGPRGHSRGAGGRVQAAEHALQARRQERLVGTRCGGWTAGGGLSPWRTSPEMEACLPESWSPTWGECAVRSRQEGGRSPRGESAWPDPPACGEGGWAPAWAWQPWQWSVGVSERETLGGESFRVPGASGPGILEQSWGHQWASSRWGAPCLPQWAPRNPPRCRCSQRAQGRRMMSRLRQGPQSLARAPASTLPASAPPAHPEVTERAGTISWAASRGLPESLASLLGSGAWPGPSPPTLWGLGQFVRRWARLGGRKWGSGQRFPRQLEQGRPRQKPRRPGSPGTPPALQALDAPEGTLCLVPTLPAGRPLRPGAGRAREDLRHWLQAPRFDGRLASWRRPAWPSPTPRRHRAAPHTLLPPSPPQR